MPTELRYDAETGETAQVAYTAPPPVVPEAVTMRQARRALFTSGLLGQVNAVIAAMPSPDREVAEIDWEFAIEVRRDNPLVVALGPALGLSNETIDALFIAAAAIE